MQYAVRWVWEMTLTTLLFSWVLVLSLRLRNVGGGGPKRGYYWAAFGLLWGLIGLSNPTLLIFLPVNGLWVLASEGGWRRQVLGAVLATLVFSLCLAPWVWRNWRVFGQFVPMRTNFGVELYLGNGPGSTGLLMEYDHPIQAADQLRLYAKIGEIAYARMRGREAMEAILADPAHFWADVSRRAYFFWAAVPHPTDDTRWVEYGRSLNFCFTSLCGWMGLGLALRRGKPAAGLFAGAFLLVPLVYYLVTVHARFRHPLEPLITVLGVYLFQAAERRRLLGGGVVDVR
jgi:hypothetical protein